HTPATTQHNRSQATLGRQPARPTRPRQLGPLDAPGTKKPGTGYFGWWVQVGGSQDLQQGGEEGQQMSEKILYKPCPNGDLT
ncbi:hypothetical protein RB213_000189, partial [Colletotrichum asianum]